MACFTMALASAWPHLRATSGDNAADRTALSTSCSILLMCALFGPIALERPDAEPAARHGNATPCARRSEDDELSVICTADLDVRHVVRAPALDAHRMDPGQHERERDPVVPLVPSPRPQMLRGHLIDVQRQDHVIVVGEMDLRQPTRTQRRRRVAVHGVDPLGLPGQMMPHHGRSQRLQGFSGPSTDLPAWTWTLMESLVAATCPHAPDSFNSTDRPSPARRRSTFATAHTLQPSIRTAERPENNSARCT